MKEAKPLRVSDYIDHIRQAIVRIDRYAGSLSREEFLASEEKQDAVIRNLEIIGEAARNLSRQSPDFIAAHPEIPWEGAYGMRNALAHGYFAVDLDIVWKTIRNDLPKLADQIRALAID